MKNILYLSLAVLLSFVSVPTLIAMEEPEEEMSADDICEEKIQSLNNDYDSLFADVSAVLANAQEQQLSMSDLKTLKFNFSDRYRDLAWRYQNQTESAYNEAQEQWSKSFLEALKELRTMIEQIQITTAQPQYTI